ncbi:hypothetical protein C5167_009371 [Papaver somniferum]|uniref:Uncharacterized protein n=1 Tax=Papaver somniferum TaxID=3469 RepID=A0A4Y7JYB5_PAPSO|nr:hypothetical protein C5167_009371 [Papaver somniferum]
MFWQLRLNRSIGGINCRHELKWLGGGCKHHRELCPPRTDNDEFVPVFWLCDPVFEVIDIPSLEECTTRSCNNVLRCASPKYEERYGEVLPRLQ